MRRTIAVSALLGFALAVASAQAAEPGPSNAPAQRAGGGTAKERLSDKASDEQRVDDCKVPPARRTQERPAACPWDVGS